MFTRYKYLYKRGYECSVSSLIDYISKFIKLVRTCVTYSFINTLTEDLSTAVDLYCISGHGKCARNFANLLK